MQFNTEEELLVKAKELEGKTFKDIDKDNLFLGNTKNKGKLGQLIEVCHFGYELNSDSRPDFEDLGIELKVTPVKQLKSNKLSAKERLVLNIIDYNKEIHLDFENSSFWSKNSELLLIFYLFDNTVSIKDMKVIKNLLYKYPSKDLEIIKKDWEIIINKIKEGNAHNLSEGDTQYLGACTKGSGSGNFRTQPFSNELASQRAYSLKSKYMTMLVRGETEASEALLTLEEVKSKLSFEDIIKSKVSKYVDMTVKELSNMFEITGESKQLNAMIVNKILGVTNINKTEEFSKSNIKLKTIRIESNGSIKESMSFRAFKFTDIIEKNYEESDIYEYFSTKKFMFAVFKHDGRDYRFKGIKLWNMPMQDIREFKPVYDKTAEVIKTGNIIKEIRGNTRLNNFPKSTENKVGHVRPHGRNKDDTYKLPFNEVTSNESVYTKQCFWLNSKYIKNILKG